MSHVMFHYDFIHAYCLSKNVFYTICYYFILLFYYIYIYISQYFLFEYINQIIIWDV